MLYLHRNNRMELLLEELGDVLTAPRQSLFQPEVIVVQSQGMERWLSMGLAERFGVWGNAVHPFPRAFIQALGQRVVGAVDAAAQFTREAMALHLALILADLPDDSRLLPMHQYLAARPGLEARLRLAEQLADAFDQTQIYRPDWCLDWAKEVANETDFRPLLFRLLMARIGEHHFPAEVARLAGLLGRKNFDASVLPERVCLFGVATLPPAFMQVFAALAQQVPVHWFLLAASREYVGAERGRRELARARSAAGNQSAIATDDFERERISQQPLLASYGRIMRDVGLLLERDCEYVEIATRDFVEPDPSSILATVQADLCALRRRGSSAEVPKLRLSVSDRSLQIHACHGPRRELEVLRQLLLDAFERDPTMRPEDVIVLLRDVEIYAPLVDAVFASERGLPGHIPYRLSDRNLGATNPIAEAVAVLLESAQLRLSATELLRLLELGPIAARFGFGLEQRSKIRKWMQELHVTWGVDMADRLQVGAKGQPEHTLRWGLSRLLLGVTMVSNTPKRWHALAPIDNEGDDAELAGALVESAESLFTWRERFARPCSFGDWHKTIGDATTQLFKVEATDAWQLADLLQTSAALASEAERAKFIELVPAAVVARRIRAHYESTRSSQALLVSGVTFCAMLPMRGIPARIVAMVGLDDGSFPRAAMSSSFDDVARSPSRPGDRVGRDEDRHLFLETLLAARERLIITYRGRNPRDDSLLPRSVVVDELLAVIDESFTVGDGAGEQASERLIVFHPLHAHSARYFDGSDARLVLRDEGQFLAALALERSSFALEVGMCEALTKVTQTELELSALERFWLAPAEYFFRNRVGAEVESAQPSIEPFDPTELDSLERYQLVVAQWQAVCQGRDEVDTLAEWTARGLRPFDNLGRVVHDEQLALTRQIHAFMRNLGAADAGRLLGLSSTVAGTELRAVLADIHDIGRVDWSPARISARHRLVAWLRHLLMAVSGQGSVSWLLRLGEKSDRGLVVERLLPLAPATAESMLEKLVRGFEVGQRAPLAFFPQISWNYAQRLYRGESSASNLGRAIREFGDPLSDEEDEFRKPVGPRGVMRQYGADPPLTEAWSKRFGIDGFPEFVQLSEMVFRPYLECVEVLEPDTLATRPVRAARTSGGRT